MSKNEKVEQSIEKKTNKPIILKFWVEGDVLVSYMICLRLISVEYP